MVLRPFLVFLERLAKEIVSDNLESFKFMLSGRIPDGLLENCSTPRQLFSCMMRNNLLEENKLEVLEELLSVSRGDLLCRVKDLRSQFPSSVMVLVHFSFFGLSEDVIQYNSGILVANMSHNFSISPQAMRYVRWQQDAPGWISVTFEVPDERGLVDQLRSHAIGVEKWLLDCGVKAVRIANEAQILLQPISATSNLATAVSHADNVCLHNDKKLDLVVIVDCATRNPIILRRWKIQLLTAIDSLFEDLDFRLALISYQNHGHLQGTGPGHSAASLSVFTDKKEEMKNSIKNLRCLGKRGSRRGLAAGLALAVCLCEDVSVDGFRHFRPEAVKVCVLMPLEDHVANLDVFKCPQGHDMTKLCDKLAQNSVTLFTVLEKVVKPGTCSSPSQRVVEAFYSGMSLRTSGQLISTQNAKLISPIILHAVEGNRLTERLFGTAYDIVVAEILRDHGDVDLEKLESKLKDGLNERSCRINQVAVPGATIGVDSMMSARKFSLDDGMDNACRTFKSELKRLAQHVVDEATVMQNDVTMEEAGSSHDVSIEEGGITAEVSERVLRKVVQRKRRI
ncbi:hypothetical protein P5673_006003 [Acropora cervicornis]|uniref:DED domain-containing protein n=1 Tax=Acropora cervicornis TaxID=6130 RepID=A0AAD9QXA7_ACRCE|nr:hypothetical protein P5673_006003 [Acropora cervicornis]